jgi:hypothetical protein
MAEDANGVECLECGVITDGATDDTIECESCGGPQLQVRISQCPMNDRRGCTSDAHHWGRGDHIVQVG